MSIVNIDRDGFWSTLHAADEIAFSTEGLISAGSIKLNSDGTVYDEYGTARADHDTVPTVTAANWRAVGCLMTPPQDETVPYRVKVNANSTNFVAHLGIGYAPASPTGSDDVISDVAVFHVQNELDGLFMIPALDSGHADYGKALAFCYIITYNTGAYGVGGISVQRLGTAPPPFTPSDRDWET